MNQIRILCVDDERNVLRALERIFMDDDYEVLTACSAEEGLQLLDEAPQVQVVISDYRMPGMNGVEFLREVFERHPQTIRIVLSGFADTAAVVAAINEGKIYKFIPKPWHDDELRMSVVKALESFAMQRRNEQLAEELRLKNEELSALNANLGRLVLERAAELVQQNRALVRATAILTHLAAGVLALGDDGAVLQLNPEAGRLLGLRPEEAIGRKLPPSLPPGLHALAAELSADTCVCRRMTVNGHELQIKGSRVVEEGEPVIALAITALCKGEEA